MKPETVIHAIEQVVGKPFKKWDGGPCMSGKDWKARGEEYGHAAVLVVCHDGGVLAPYFNYAYNQYAKIEKMNTALEAIGAWAEPCTSWYTAIYKV